MKTAYDILIRPILTEKAVKDNEKNNVLVFEVAMDANKIEIRKAVEEIFGVKVKEVRTQIVKPKPKRVGFRAPGYTKKWKKAIIKVISEKPINITELV
ncbi:50S ribosomal protein L23 [Venenivibrio stagnispumantis]|uniref:Large ribosomal subunit protein uL23 n=1 Tax=Venenivibrio stagnispumantis TaxID=407998 RepID=A0AA45WLK9_9AQUI|nr:50S ribosomal protein L23 [Venenivibrio stagnispumantis]MCW4573315.1 50S ribosomal protein L23 [Venenivibrio stagnispumantis]SMP10981.1 large subunit ribosomal protein L23 [Venenivibrio stagnispumantis]